MANHLRPNGIIEERVEANVCRRGIVMRDSTRIRVKKGKPNREVEMGVRRNMPGKEGRI